MESTKRGQCRRWISRRETTDISLRKLAVDQMRIAKSHRLLILPKAVFAFSSISDHAASKIGMEISAGQGFWRGRWVGADSQRIHLSGERHHDWGHQSNPAKNTSQEKLMFGHRNSELCTTEQWRKAVISVDSWRIRPSRGESEVSRQFVQVTLV